MQSYSWIETSLLVEHLSRNEASTLATLLGPSTMALLSKKLGAASPKGLAYFFVNVHGAHKVLKRSDIRELLISGLDKSEATALCELLQLPALFPHQTLKATDFDKPRNLELLERWYGLETGEPEVLHQRTEGSEKAVASHKLRAHQLSAFRDLRRAIAKPSATLVHMPFGAGKLRLVATAALDFFRSEDDGRSVVWLAPGAAMCEEAFLELREVWRQLGSRDTTLLQMYGNYPSRDLDRLGGAIAVIDIFRVNKDSDALMKLGATTSVAILADAENLVHPVGAEIIGKMLSGGAFPLVGILASPGAAIPLGHHRNDLKAAFRGGCITVGDEGESHSPHDVGDFMHVSGSIVELTASQTTAAAAPAAGEVSSLDFDEAYVSRLADDVQRNESLLALLQAEAKSIGRVVFYATTSSCARLFAGLLPVLGIPASSITSDEPLAARTLAIQRFVARDEKVLCVHGFLLAGSSIPDIASCVIASPIKSKASLLSTIGRLVQSRDVALAPLRLVVTADAKVDASLVASLGTWSTLGDWSALDF